MNRARMVVGLVAMFAACSATSQSTRMLPLKDLMEHVIDPAADVFWGASGTIVTEKGETNRAPTTDDGWDAAYNAAATLFESGNLLTMKGRARDQKEWLQYSRALQDAAAAGMRAAKAKDERAVFDTGGQIYVACRSCHMKYLLGYK